MRLNTSTFDDRGRFKTGHPQINKGHGGFPKGHRPVNPFPKGYTYWPLQPFWNRKWLENELLQKHKSTKAIATQLGVSRESVTRWASHFGLRSPLFSSNGKPVRIPQPCANCGKTILCKPSAFRRHPHGTAYCSTPCYLERRRVLYQGVNNPNFKNGGIRLCIKCGKRYQTYAKTRKYCSPICATVDSPFESMANLRRGIEAERRCMGALESKGYRVFRSAASKGAFDVIAIRATDLLLIQVKCTKEWNRRAPEKVLNQLRNTEVPLVNCIQRQLWCWVDRRGWVITPIPFEE